MEKNRDTNSENSRVKSGHRSRIRLAQTVLVFLLMLGSIGTVYARERIKTDARCSLEVVLKYQNVKMEGFDIRVYKVAAVSPTGRYTLTDRFAGSGVILDGLDAAGWGAATTTLGSYVDFNRPEPEMSARTGEDGTVTFEDIGTGLYFVRGGQVLIGNHVYSPRDFLVSLPGEDKAKDCWIYDVTVDQKVSRTSGSSGGSGGGGSVSVLNYRVIKLWKNDSEATRPASIEVVLMRDGSPCAEAVLNKDNDWSKTWTGLSMGYTYSVTEKVIPPGYTVTVEKNGTTFTVTNTGGSSVPPSGGGGGGSTSYPGPGGISSEAGILPQTGLLWWPLPVLIAAGVLLIALGILIKKKSS